MTKYRLEYIWLDGYTPVPNLRGKTQLKDFDAFPTLAQLPLWGFDGSSTMQAEGHSSDCVLKPVAVYPDGARTNGVLVMCEVMMPDGVTPHASNKRATVLFLIGDYEASIRDVDRTLALEPRHFGALSGLGLINAELGNDEAALEAFEKALAINPTMEGVKRNADDMRRRIEGRSI